MDIKFDLNGLLENIKASLTMSSGSHNKIIGIDIGSANIKIVQLKKQSGKVTLETYGEIAIGPFAGKLRGEVVILDQKVVVSAIKDLIKEAKITTNNAGIALQSSASLIFSLMLPHVPEKERAGLVYNESRKYIPVPISEVSLDWWLVPQPNVSNSEKDTRKDEVLVAVVRNEKLELYKDIVKNLAMKSFFEIELFSAMRATLGVGLAPMLIVDMGASGTRVAVVQYGTIKRFNNIKNGSNSISQIIKKTLGVSFEEAEELKKKVGLYGAVADGTEQKVRDIIDSEINRIFTRVSNYMNQYEKDYERAVSKIILLGGAANIIGLQNFVENNFSGEVVLADPFSHIDAPEIMADALRVAGPEFAIAIGLALKKFE